MNTFSKMFRQFKDRLTGENYKIKLREALDKYQSGVEELPAVHFASMSSEINEELHQTRTDANKLLEKIVERSVVERRRLEIIFDSLDDAVFITNYDGTIVDVSSKARQMFKMSTAEFKNKMISDLFLKANAETLRKESSKYFEYLKDIWCKFDCANCDTNCQADELRDMYTTYVRTKPTVLSRPLFFEHQCVDGSILSAQIVLNILTLEIHNVEDLNYVAVVRNLTADKQAKAESSKLQSFHSNLMSITPIPVFYKGADLRFTSVSNSFKELLKLVESDIIGKSADQVFTTESAADLTELEQNAISTGKQQSKTLDLKTLNGIEQIVNVFTRSIRLDSKNTMGIAGAVYTKLAADSNARAVFFNLVAKSIVFVDEHSSITGCNDEFIRLSGYAKTNLIGTSTEDVRVANFFTPMEVGANSDDIIANEHQVNRLCIPLIHELGKAEGFVYIFFTQSDKI